MGEAREGAPASRTSSSGPDALIGRVINDRFRVMALIARGGMGKVYRAEQAPLGRQVALKILNPNYSGDSDPEFHKRFFLEASTCSKLSHPNTVTIFDYGRTDDDVYYIAMELLEGRTLYRALREDGPLAPARAMHIARQICRSLREAHGLGVIHRDLKPANIFLVRHGDESDVVKVLDFGLVKDIEAPGEDLTQTGLFMGSPKYMAPEQIRGDKVDGRADIYALGVILYETLTGKVPFDRPNSVNILMAHVHEAPPPFHVVNPEVEVPAALEALVMRTLSKQPEERYSSMDELLGALKDLAADGGVSVTRSTDLGLSGEFAALPPPARVPVIVTNSDLSSLPPPTPTALAATEPRRPPWAAIGIAGAIVAALSTAVVLAVIWGPGEAPTRPTQTQPVVRRIEPTKTDPGTPQQTSTMVVLRSTPGGARVAVGEREYGPTPADVEWTGSDAERGRNVTFRFHLDGYRDFSITRIVNSDRLEVSAVLEALPHRPIRPFRPRPHNNPGESSVGPVKGYKIDPY